MALSIKDAETDRLVRRYARKHATSFTGAIKLAVSNALRQEGEAVEEDEDCQRRRETFYQAVREAQRAYAALPVVDPRTPDELLYDEDGLPK